MAMLTIIDVDDAPKISMTKADICLYGKRAKMRACVTTECVQGITERRTTFPLGRIKASGIRTTPVTVISQPHRWMNNLKCLEFLQVVSIIVPRMIRFRVEIITRTMKHFGVSKTLGEFWAALVPFPRPPTASNCTQVQVRDCPGMFVWHGINHIMTRFVVLVEYCRII
jgi:hypothetical protein